MGRPAFWTLLFALALVVGLRGGVHAQGNDELPDVGARNITEVLGRMTTSSGAHRVLQHGRRAFVVTAVLDDCVKFAELETRDGEPALALDSTPESERVLAVWGHDKA